MNTYNKIVKIDYKKLLLAELLAWSAGIIGSIFTFSEIQTWYATLVKPGITPPNSLFGPMWTTLYTLMGIAYYLIWDKKNNGIARALFYIQLILNALWSIVFFGLHQLNYGLVIILFLWFFILACIIEFRLLDKKAGYVLLPYLAWVTAATLLNASVAWLN